MRYTLVWWRRAGRCHLHLDSCWSPVSIVPSLGTILLSLVIAFIPALAYTLLVWWLDRYEREPFRLLVISFCWGAVPAIALAILLEIRLGDPFAAVEQVLLRQFATDSLLVPVIEEATKGAALLVLFVLVRHEFDNVLDGIVYGSVIGFGFAMTENALYFADLLQRGYGERFTTIVMLRLLLFGLNHAFYSAIVGAGFGLAAEVTGPLRRWRWTFPLLGLMIAIAFHAVHNLGLALAASSRAALLIAILANWGGVFLLIVIVLLAWNEERRWIAVELWPEVGATLTPEDYALATSYGQRLALWYTAWRQGGWRAAQRKSHHHTLITRLAFLKHRLRTTGATPAIQTQIDQVRAQLLAQGAN